MSETKKEMTWAKAVLIGTGITASLILTLGFVPSIFTYWWEGQVQNVIDLIKGITGRAIQPYTTIRIRDAISMGYQTFIFAAYVIATYIYMERRRRRLGQRGVEGVQGYLSGK